jgi:thiamine phosphate synthase YjbQ (UPF0047 family)
MRFNIKTKGFNDVIDITQRISELVKKSKVKEGICLIFVAHSTCALTTIEYEEGAMEDLKRALEIVAPMNENYEHCKKCPSSRAKLTTGLPRSELRFTSGWGDCNGYAHVRAALMKPCLTTPIENGKLVLGQWQQLVFIDFDNRPREREIIVKVIRT